MPDLYSNEQLEIGSLAPLPQLNLSADGLAGTIGRCLQLKQDAHRIFNTNLQPDGKISAETRMKIDDKNDHMLDLVLFIGAVFPPTNEGYSWNEYFEHIEREYTSKLRHGVTSDVAEEVGGLELRETIESIKPDFLAVNAFKHLQQQYPGIEEYLHRRILQEVDGMVEPYLTEHATTIMTFWAERP